MLTLRRFTDNDYMAFAGAENFSKSLRPLIGEFEVIDDKHGNGGAFLIISGNHHVAELYVNYSDETELVYTMSSSCNLVNALFVLNENQIANSVLLHELGFAIETENSYS